MKFSEIDKAQWDELKPYLDTCLLPVTGMSGSEQPHEAVEWLEKLRDVMDLIEIPFKGRVVTYPAMHYATDKAACREAFGQWSSAMRTAGFKYVIAATAHPDLELQEAGADVAFGPNSEGELPRAEDISAEIRHLWSGIAE